MATQKVYHFPKAAQEYLLDTYGLPSYSERHLKRLIQAGKYPKPFALSASRRALTKQQLDVYAAQVIAKATTAA
jgi:hypothetical protein